MMSGKEFRGQDAEVKRQMRAYFREQRNQLDPKQALTDSQVICRKLMEFDRVIRASSLLLYSAVGNEVNLHLLAGWAMKKGKILAYPRCCGKEMDFYTITDFSQLSHKGSFGIREPEGTVPFVPDKDTCMIAPGVAFSVEGARLGMGGGYYDRYLKRYPQIYRIGVCHTCQLTDDWIMEAHDQRVDIVISPD